MELWENNLLSKKKNRKTIDTGTVVLKFKEIKPSKKEQKLIKTRTNFYEIMHGYNNYFLTNSKILQLLHWVKIPFTNIFLNNTRFALEDGSIFLVIRLCYPDKNGIEESQKVLFKYTFKPKNIKSILKKQKYKYWLELYNNLSEKERVYLDKYYYNAFTMLLHDEYKRKKKKDIFRYENF